MTPLRSSWRSKGIGIRTAVHTIRAGTSLRCRVRSRNVRQVRHGKRRGEYPASSPAFPTATSASVEFAAFDARWHPIRSAARCHTGVRWRRPGSAAATSSFPCCKMTRACSAAGTRNSKGQISRPAFRNSGMAWGLFDSSSAAATLPVESFFPHAEGRCLA